MPQRIHWTLWERKYRPICKKQFEEWGITSCEIRFEAIEGWEGCKGSAFVGFAHSKKVKYTEHDMMEVIAACSFCHNVIEGRILDKRIGRFWTKEEMYEIVVKIISERIIW